MIKANTCPYCGGPYTVQQACHGPRTEVRGENCCPGMARHVQLVQEAIDADLTEQDEIDGR